MSHRLLLSIALVAAAGATPFGTPLGAQIIRVTRTGSPIAWVSASAGIFQPRSVNDGTTNSVWDFNAALQWRASLEVAMQREASFGVTGTWSDVPLRYYDAGEAAGGACAISVERGCDAHAKLWSVMASFHVGGGPGFHQVLELTGGAMGYSEFTHDASGVRIGPAKADLDFALGISYGFGYSVTPRLQIALAQDYTAVLHQRENLPGGASALAQHQATRLAVRYGLGTRSRL